MKKYCLLSLTALALAYTGNAQTVTKFDKTFGGGWVTENLDTFEISYDMLVQTDGKVVTCGITAGLNNKEKPFLLRYNKDGSRDNTFGVKGLVNLAFGNNGVYEMSIATNSSGQFYVAGSRRDASGPFYLARLHSNGSPDNTWGTSGILTDSIGTDVADDEHVYTMAVQPDNKILLTGYLYDKAAKTNDVWVMRYNTDGTRDNNFGTNGLVLLRINNASPNRIILQSDNKILIGGEYKHPVQQKQDFLLIRLNNNGTTDNTFDSDGILQIGLQDIEQVTGIGLQKDGSIIVGGPCGNGYSQYNILKVKPNGTGDIDFGTLSTSTGNWGYTRIDLQKYSNQYPSDLVVLSDDKIFLAGSIDNYKLVTFRFTADGMVDSTFGKNGIVDSSFAPNSGRSSRARADEKSGRIYITGTESNADTHVDRVFVAAIKIGDDMTGIHSQTVHNDLKIFPNPATDKLTLIYTGSKPALLSIYSSLGQRVLNALYKQGDTLYTGDLLPGIYTLVLESAEGYYNAKLIID